MLGSCGVFRKVHKESTLDKISTTKILKSDSSSFKIDKTVTTIKEKVDTDFIIPGKIVSQQTYFNMDSLVKGMTAVKNDLIDVRFKLNPTTHALTTTATLKPRPVPVQIDKETTIRNDVASGINHMNEVNQESAEEHRTNLVDKEPKHTIWLTLGFLGLAFVVIRLAYVYLKR